MKSYIPLLIIAAVLITTGVAMAQPTLPEPADQAPIDGGLGLLAAAGGAYAYKKLRDKKRENLLDEENQSI